MTPTEAGTRPALIGLDWGTTSIRAYLLSATGAVAQQREGDEGLLNARQRASGRCSNVTSVTGAGAILGCRC